MKHRYDHTIDPDGGSAAARLARMIAPSSQILELGSGPGAVTRILHGKHCKVTAVEIDAVALDLCRPFCDQAIQANLLDTTWETAIAGRSFDAIVLADVIEHLPDPGVLLKRLRTFLGPDGALYLSVPNASHASVMACLLKGRFPYQKKGLLDETHIRFFGREDISRLLNTCGYQWGLWETVELDPAISELSPYWHALSEEERSFLRHHDAEWLAYQYVIKAYPTSASGTIARLQSETEAERMQIAALEAEIKAEREQTATLEAEINTLKSSLIDAMDQICALEKESMNSKKEINTLSNSICKLQASRSWKMTRPLRAINKLLGL